MELLIAIVIVLLVVYFIALGIRISFAMERARYKIDDVCTRIDESIYGLFRRKS